MINAKEARDNVKAYKEAQEMVRLARVNEWLEKIGKRIEYASCHGYSNVAVEDMEVLSDSMVACGMLAELGYKVERFSDRDALKISWTE